MKKYLRLQVQIILYLSTNYTKMYICKNKLIYDLIYSHKWPSETLQTVQVLDLYVRFQRDHREAAAFSMNWASFTSRLVKPPQSCEVRVIWTYEGKSSFSDLRETCGRDPRWFGNQSISQHSYLRIAGRWFRKRYIMKKHCIFQTQRAWGAACTCDSHPEGRLPEDKGSQLPAWEACFLGKKNRDESSILTPRTLITPALLRPLRKGKPTYQAVPEWGRKAAGYQMRKHGGGGASLNKIKKQEKCPGRRRSSWNWKIRNCFFLNHNSEVLFLREDLQTLEEI